MDRLNFNHLFYFYVVAKEGSIKKASEKLHVTQPTISDQIKELEVFFDSKLFERQHRSLILTKQGQLALRYSENIFDLGNELTSQLRHRLSTPKTSVDIGMTLYMSQYFLYDKIVPLFEQNEVSVNVVEGERHLLLAELEEGNLDLIFSDNKESLPSTIESYRVGLNKTFVVAHRKYQELSKGFPESLNELAFMNYTSESYLKYEIELFFSRYSLAPRILGSADNMTLFQTIVEKGLGFVIVPEVSKDWLCLNPDVVVLGELEELQTSVWGILKKSYQGVGRNILSVGRC